MNNGLVEMESSDQKDRRGFSYYTYRLRGLLSGKRGMRLLVLMVVLIALPVVVYLANQYVKFRSRAEGEEVSLYVVPSEQVMPPDANFQVMLASGTHEIGFVQVELAFDNTKVNLASEIQTSPLFGTIVDKTSAAEANFTGVISIAVALSVDDLTNTIPTGVFEVANFTLKSVSGALEDTSSISFNPDGQYGVVVSDMNEQELTFTTSGSSFTLNPSSSVARLYFSDPRPVNPQVVNSPFDIDVLMDTGGESVDGVDAKISFDKNFLRVSDIAEDDSGVFASYPLTTYDNAAGTMVVSANIGTASDAVPVNGTGIRLATVNVVPLAATSSTQLVYDFTAGERNDSNIALSGTLEYQDPVDILAAVGNATIIVDAVPTATLTPTAEPTQISQGWTFMGCVREGTEAKPTGETLKGVEIRVSGWTGSVYEYLGSVYTDNQTGCFEQSMNSTNGYLQWRFIEVDPLGYVSSSAIAPEPGEVVHGNAIQYSTAIPQGEYGWMYFFDRLADSTPTPTGYPTPTPTVTPVPTNTPTPTDVPPTATPTPIQPVSLMVKFLFQGRIREGVSKVKQVTLNYKRVGGNLYSPVVLTTNSSGEALISLPPENYVMLAKSPGYLARSFGSAESPITISSGQTYLDLSARPLLGGDFNGDGVVNEVDYSLRFLPNFLSDDAIVDLDGSGEVNNLDFAIMRANWNLVDDTI